jgi:CBS domain-containing protein
MLARDLMRSDVITAREDQSAADVMAVLVREHIHGIPVVDGEGKLVGIVTQQDVFFSSVTRGRPGEAAGEKQEELLDLADMKVGDLMTSPAVSATEETDILALCRMMHRMRIHRVPIVRDGELTGIISSLDICAALANGAYRPDGGDE